MFLCFFSGSPYYDNVRPLSYPDSDAVLICFDISRPETLDSVLKKASAGDNGTVRCWPICKTEMGVGWGSSNTPVNTLLHIL